MIKYLAIDFPARDAFRSLVRPDDLFNKGRSIEPDRISQELREDELRMLWGVEGGGLGIPLAIIGQRDNLEDLLPRLLSQPGTVEPVTSVMRAWDIRDLERLPFDAQRSLNSFVAAGIVGLLIAEIQIAGGQSLDLRRCGLDVSRRTLTFTCGTAWALGMAPDDLPELIRRWLEVSEFIGSTRSLEVVSTIGSLWGFLMSLAEQTPPSWEVSPQELGQYIHRWRATLDDRSQGDLLLSNLLDTTAELMRLSRESRYSAIVQLLDSGNSLSALECGFLISLIDPGSFDFFELANKHSNDADGAVFAYSLCAGILGGKSTLGRFNGFGANVLLKGFAVAPQLNVDISLHELRIIRKIASESYMDFRSRSPSILDVEILPRVVASFSYGSAKRSGASTRSTGISEEHISHLEEALRALDFASSVLSELKGSASNTRGVRRRAGR
ncbi:hypothetical protein P3G55_20255 [Leptospira sp. 96542]|nr:hypothetical protein [Leptospira sp. 96542]